MFVTSPVSDGRIVVEFTSCSSYNVCDCVFVPTLRPITLCTDADHAAAAPAMAPDTQEPNPDPNDGEPASDVLGRGRGESDRDGE